MSKYTQISRHRTHVPLLRWSILHHFYDPLLFISGLGPHFKQKITELAPIKGCPQRILDVGCGTGTHLRILSKAFHNAQVYGIDPDPKIVEWLINNLSITYSNVRVENGYGDDMPFDEGAFDLCFSTLTFHHLDTVAKQKTMREIFRILKPGGTFMLTDWGVSRVAFLRFLLIFEHQEYLDDHLSGKIPLLARDAGFALVRSTRVKPSGIWTWEFHKPL